jgi:hypothetical protein
LQLIGALRAPPEASIFILKARDRDVVYRLIVAPPQKNLVASEISGVTPEQPIPMEPSFMHYNGPNVQPQKAPRGKMLSRTPVAGRASSCAFSPPSVTFTPWRADPKVQKLYILISFHMASMKFKAFSSWKTSGKLISCVPRVCVIRVGTFP